MEMEILFFFIGVTVLFERNLFKVPNHQWRFIKPLITILNALFSRNNKNSSTLGASALGNTRCRLGTQPADPAAAQQRNL